MTVTAAGAPGGDPGDGGDGGSGGDPRRAARWVAVAFAGETSRCHGLHQGGGRLDESARRLSHEELAVAELLASEGHQVRSLPESRHGGRKADLDVCGSPVEVKSYLSLSDRRGAPSPQSVFNKLLDAAGQANSVVLVGKGSGLTPQTVRRGMSLLAESGRAPTVSSVRAVGDGFDMSWIRRPGLALDSPAPGRHIDSGRDQRGGATNQHAGPRAGRVPRPATDRGARVQPPGLGL